MGRSNVGAGLSSRDEVGGWRFLGKHSIGRVAIVHLGSPMVFPVNYALDGRTVVFHTGSGTKLGMAVAGCETAFEVDDAYDVLETGASVMVHGTMQRVTATDEKARVEKLGLRTWAPGKRDHVVRVSPAWISGRRIPVHSNDEGLSADAG